MQYSRLLFYSSFKGNGSKAEWGRRYNDSETWPLAIGDRLALYQSAAHKFDHRLGHANDICPHQHSFHHLGTGLQLADEHYPIHLPRPISSFLRFAWEKRRFAAALRGTACLGAGPSTVALINTTGSLLLANQIFVDSAC
jgi:hypothetical protein